MTFEWEITAESAVTLVLDTFEVSYDRATQV